MSKTIKIVTQRVKQKKMIADILEQYKYNVSIVTHLGEEEKTERSLILFEYCDANIRINKKLLGILEYNRILFMVETIQDIPANILQRSIVMSLPFNVNALISSVQNAFNGYEAQCMGSILIGRSKFILELKEKIEKIAKTSANVLITGESGTGKGVIADEIVKASHLNHMKYTKINCTAIPETLLESELFGYKKGAFTGADSDYEGKLVAASGGTLLLDEIGDLPLQLQSKLLRVLEENFITPLGSSEQIPINIRYIFVTNKNLNHAVEQGLFRKDLYYRINTIELKVIPLRERKEDIPYLVDFFIDKFNKKYSKRVSHPALDLMDMIYKINWSGNIRELEHMIERMVIYASEGEDIKFDDSFPKVSTNAASNTDIPVVSVSNYREAMNSYEKYLINDFLLRNNGNVSRTAQIMGVERTNLYKKIRRLGIDVEKNKNL